MITDYWYDRQIKRYLLQFTAIFQDLYIKVGKNSTRNEGLIKVPIIMASLDRVAVAAATGHTQNRKVRLPMLSTNIGNIELAQYRMKGTGIVSREVYVPLGGTIEDDAKVVYQRTANPYDILADLYIYTSNKDQQFQILEQILVLFEPNLQLQTNDGPFDPTKIVSIELLNMSNDENFPPNADSSNIVITLHFKISAYLSIKSDIRDNIVKKIKMRISAIDEPSIGTIFSSGEDNSEIGSIFDEEGIEPSINIDVTKPPNI